MESERGESRFVSNTVALVFQTVAATLLTLFQVKLLSNFLPKETFGLFASLRGLSLILSMLAAHGLPQLLVRFLPAHESQRERGRAFKLVAWCSLGSVAGLLVVAAIAHAVARLTFGVVPRELLTGDLYLWFYATTLGVTLKLILYGGLSGLRRFGFQVLLETLSLAAVLVWFAVERRQLTLPVLFEILGVVNLITAVVGFGPFLVYANRATAGQARPPGEGTPRGRYKSYLGWAVGLSLVALAFSDADRYLLAQVLSLELLAVFHIGARLGRLANRLLGVANLAFQPEVTRLDSEGRDGRVVESTRVFLKFNSVFAVLMTALLMVFAREMIVIVSSDAYTAGVPLLMIFALSLPLTTMTAPFTTVMKAVDQVKGALWCDLAWAACYVALIFALAPAFGLVGVGLAQLIACGMQLALALRLSKLGIGAGDVWRLAGKLVFCGGVAFFPAVGYGLIADHTSFYAALGIKAVIFIVGVVLFRGLVRISNVLDGDERRTLKAMLERRRLGVVGRLVGV